MTASGPSAEGVVSFQGFRTWYRIVGTDLARPPLLVVHGGPGASHDYLEPLEALATDRRVIFYDQLGGGKSDHPHNPSLWTVSLFLDELATLRRALGLHQVHLFGHSWGGMLALEHALEASQGIASLVVANAAPNMSEWRAELARLRAELPPEFRDALLKHEAAGTTSHVEYLAAVLAFYKRHVCRLAPWPPCLNRTFAGVTRDPEVYQTMYGPNDLHVTGRLRDWSVSERLSKLRIPALVLSGRYDHATRSVVDKLHRGLIGSEWIELEHSSHTPHLEETTRFLEAVRAFLRRVEATTSRPIRNQS
ncbi:MAG: proline iminopeptidase-family hydrolase [Chloroflexota bacterium]|nr:proline iminopeptidase-family hydrolase [Chloroflexota bacterium]